MSTTTHSTTAIFDSSIGYDRLTRDYIIIIAGEVIGYAASFHDAEAIRTQALAARIPDGQDGFDDVPAGDGEPQ